MSVYLIIEIKIKDKKTYSEYIEKARPIIEKHQGRYLARGGKIVPIFGDWNPERIVLIEFPSSEDVTRCFSCQEYKEIASLRERSTITEAITVEGYKDNNT